jgi:predicted permease
MKLLRRLDYWLHRRKRDAELAEELEFHRAHTGSPDLGNTTLAREDARAVWIWPWLESVAQDLRYALRNLKRQPGFALIALLTLGLAIGLNTSFFTVFDAVALRLWPVKDPAHVAKVMSQGKRGPRGFSLAETRYLRDHSKSMTGMVAMNDERVVMGFEDFGKASYVMFVSGDYFQVLGVPMLMGRGFLPEEDKLEEPVNVTVLSFAMWRDHFGSDSTILGKQVHMNDVMFTVVGVAAEEFRGTTAGNEDLWAPLPALQSISKDPETRAFLRSPDDCCSSVSGRLASGFTQTSARAELDVLSRQFRDQNKLEPASVVMGDATMLSGHPKRRTFMPVFGLMFVGLILVLLLACMNISNLLIARAVARQHEIEVRRALGAGRARIVRQLLTEGFLLALGASAIGIALAYKLPGYVFAIAGEGPNVRLVPDAMVILFAAAMAGLSAIVFGLAPALHGTRPNRDRSRLQLRNVLLAGQVALSVVLLIGAGLMVEGVQRARHNDPGFRINDVSEISFDMPSSSYGADRITQFSSTLVHDLASVDGMKPFGVAERAPLDHSHWFTGFRLPGEAIDTSHDIEAHQIDGGYLDVLGIPIVAGRNFQAGDATRNVALVNESMAKRYFDGANPVGKSLIIGKRSLEIVGEVRDAYLNYLDGVGPQLFEPFSGTTTPTLLVRSSAKGAVDTVAGIARQIDPRIRLRGKPLSDNLVEQLAGSRTMAGIAGMLGVFALILAVIGMSGVFAYVVQQRTKEIGIRMALGADPSQVIGLVLSGAARAALVGLAIGFVAAAGVAKLLAEYLYGVSPYDPRAYFEVAAILAISALAAAYLPARRATRVDPLNALRVE